MADSPPRSDTPDSAPGDDLDPPQAAGDGAAPQEAAAEPAPWGGSRPWWSADSGDGTGPHRLPNGTGPQVPPAPRDGSGAHRIPAPANGSGAHPLPGGTGPHAVLPDGTGPQVAIPGGSGAHPVIPGGSGAYPVIPDGTGPLPVLPGQPPAAKRRRLPRLLLVAGAATVAAVVLMAGVLAFRTDGGGGEKDVRTTGVPASKKTINAGADAGGLHKDGLTSPQASAAYPFIAAAVAAGGIPVARRGRAVYSEEPARPVNVLFMGGTGPVGNPADFLQKIQPTTFIAGQDADPGKKGGKAVCGTFSVLAATHTYCAWATRDSYGVVASNRATLNPQFTLMADVMRRIRNAVEKPR